MLEQEGLLLALYRTALEPDEYSDFIRKWLPKIDELLEQDGVGWNDSHESHVRAALDVIERLKTATYGQGDLNEWIETQSQPTLLLDVDGKIVAANRVFQSRWQGSRSIYDVAHEAKDQAKIRSGLLALHQLADPRASLVSFEEDDAMHYVSLRRHNQSDGSSLYSATFAIPMVNDSLGVFLKEQFQLSPAELWLLNEMVRTGRFNEISEASGKAFETVKSQAKSIYRKLGVQGRDDILRLIIQLEGVVAGAQLIVRETPDSPRSGFVSLSDGRRIAWKERGARNGQRVLFTHGIGLGHAMSKQFEQGMADLGLTIVCVDRPGYGDSDPPKNWKRPVEEWIAIFPEIVDRLSITSDILFSSTGGVVYSVAAAANHPHLVRGVCTFSSGVPITDPAMFSSYPLQIQIAAKTSRISSTALRFLIMAAAADYKRPEKRDQLIREAYGEIAPDAEGLNDPEIWECVHQGMELIARGGFDGYVGDCLLLFQDWSGYMRDARAPIHYFNGTLDNVCPTDWVRAISQRYANVFLHEIDGAGQLACHTHTKQVFEALEPILEGMG